MIKTFGTELAGLVNEMSPYLLLGFFFAGLLRVAFPTRIITRYMGGGNFRSVLNASLLGVPLPLCSCGVLPTGIGFFKNGASRGSTTSFLISTPQTGVDSILATYAMLGLPLAIIRPVVALFTGVGGGVLANWADRKENGKKGQDHKAEPRSELQSKSEPEPVQERSVKELFRYGFVELLQDISKWLIIGMLAAALLSVLIPSDFFTASISNEYLSMIMMLAASVPLYICATGSIPIAAVLIMKGLSPGAALVLLMAGPATNIATMAVIGNAMGRRSLWVYLISIIGGALLFGTLVNELIPREWITGWMTPGKTEHIHEHSAGWFQWVASGALVLLILNGYIMKLVVRQRMRKEEKVKMENMGTQFYTYRVEGMTCNHCKASVEKGLSNMGAITEVVADPGNNQVRVQAEGLSDSQVKDTIEGLGYTFKGRIE
ncbi:MAG: SO_0444 family Cu/Zn efflux transporter [Bacteroidetes bacterium]|nr:SO_0444 family Cu/Zn efflux transporter [Bacteroidota bacterium]